MVEVESALRHKARLERHQRTAERVVRLIFLSGFISVFALFASSLVTMHITYFQTKALAEKNMRDVLAQREQAEKHVRLYTQRETSHCICIYSQYRCLCISEVV